MSGELQGRVLCKRCDIPLPDLQVQKLGNPDFNEWYRNGYCSLKCYDMSIATAIQTGPPHTQAKPVVQQAKQPPSSQLRSQWSHTEEVRRPTESGTRKAPKGTIIARLAAFLFACGIMLGFGLASNETTGFLMISGAILLSLIAFPAHDNDDRVIRAYLTWGVGILSLVASLFILAYHGLKSGLAGLGFKIPTGGLQELDNGYGLIIALISSLGLIVMGNRWKKAMRPEAEKEEPRVTKVEATISGDLKVVASSDTGVFIPTPGRKSVVEYLAWACLSPFYSLVSSVRSFAILAVISGGFIAISFYYLSKSNHGAIYDWYSRTGQYLGRGTDFWSDAGNWVIGIFAAFLCLMLVVGFIYTFMVKPMINANEILREKAKHLNISSQGVRTLGYLLASGSWTLMALWLWFAYLTVLALVSGKDLYTILASSVIFDLLFILFISGFCACVLWIIEFMIIINGAKINEALVPSKHT